MTKIIYLFVLLILMSGCATVNNPFVVQYRELEKAYQDKKITTAEYLQLKQNLAAQEQQRLYNNPSFLQRFGAGVLANTHSDPLSVYHNNNSQQQMLRHEGIQMMRDAQQSAQQYYRDINNQSSAIQPMTQSHTTCRWVGGQYICDTQQY